MASQHTTEARPPGTPEKASPDTGKDGGCSSPGRTDLAEDRTLLANERTFSAWVRTAMAAMGVALGSVALFRPVEPTWVAKGVATLFVLLGVAIVFLAERRARRLSGRLESHEVSDLAPMQTRIVAWIVVAGAASLVVSIWWLM